MIEATGLVLKTRPYRETSMLVTLFTREIGVVGAVARGQRAANRGTQLQPFCTLSLGLSGRGSLKTLARSELIQSYDLKGDALASGFYAMELLYRALAEGQVETSLFDGLLGLFQKLEQSTSLACEVRQFERLLLDQSGYAVDFSSAAGASGDRVEPDMFYQYISETGFVPCNPEHSRAIPGTVLLALAAGEYSNGDVLRHARVIQREALKPLIGHQPIASRHLLQAASIDEPRA